MHSKDDVTIENVVLLIVDEELGDYTLGDADEGYVRSGGKFSSEGNGGGLGRWFIVPFWLGK